MNQPSASNAQTFFKPFNAFVNAASSVLNKHALDVNQDEISEQGEVLGSKRNESTPGSNLNFGG